VDLFLNITNDAVPALITETGLAGEYKTSFTFYTRKAMPKTTRSPLNKDNSLSTLF
jgi:hypothetical protein